MHYFCTADLKISDLEGELEDNINPPGDHSGQLYRAQSDMSMMCKAKTYGKYLNVPNQSKLAQQNCYIDPHRNLPLTFTQTWLSKESGISLSMEDEVVIKVYACMHACMHTRTHTHTL